MDDPRHPDPADRSAPRAVPGPITDPDLLELRIHGVRNTPPHEMLRTGADRVQSCRGDRLAGFTTYTRPRPAASPRGRRVEAYGWGLLARHTGLPGLGRIGDALVRVLWFSLAPYGLANTAYWSRQRVGGRPADDGDGRQAHHILARAIGGGLGAGTIRLLGLLLTLLYMTTAASVAWDMAARQCFTGGAGVACGPLSALLVPMAGWAPGARTAAFLALPLSALVVVHVLPALARTRYLPGAREDASPPDAQPGDVPPGDVQPDDVPTADPPRGAAAAAAAVSGAGPEGPGAQRPLLAWRDFWVVGAGMGRLRRLHSAAALAWLAAVIAASRVDGMAAAGWGDWWARSAGWPVALAAALLLVAGAAALLFGTQAEVPGHAKGLFHTAYLLACAALLAAVAAYSSLDRATPASGRGGAMAATAVVLLTALVLLVILGQSLRVSSAAESRRLLGWAGLGPFVFAALAAGFGSVLSFFAVLTAGWALGGLEAPMVFVLLGAGFALLLLGAVVVLVWFEGRVWWAGRGQQSAEELAAVRRELLHDAGAWAEDDVVDRAAREVWRVRRITALLRKAEVFAGGLGWAVFAGVWAGGILAVLWLAGVPAPDHWLWAAARVSGGMGLWAGLLVIAGLVVASSRSEARPFALLWDLMCFLPTQAHPFGPPCYSERVVPELADRVTDWLDGLSELPGPGRSPAGSAVEDPSRRRTVISAHSMGFVLTVCALFHLQARGMDPDKLARIGVVSYGVQVRRYFARFFPAVLGPRVLSIVPAGPPSATGRDPWPPTAEGEVAEEARDRRLGGTEPAAPGEAGEPGALAEVLGDRWVNLYRATDPLGFPVRYLGGPAGRRAPMDRRAEEFQRGAYQFVVATHGHYLETAAYAAAFRVVAGKLGHRGRDLPAAPDRLGAGLSDEEHLDGRGQRHRQRGEPQRGEDPGVRGQPRVQGGE